MEEIINVITNKEYLKIGLSVKNFFINYTRCLFCSGGSFSFSICFCLLYAPTYCLSRYRYVLSVSLETFLETFLDGGNGGQCGERSHRAQSALDLQSKPSP